jgi:hypothetical protein
VLTLDRGRLVGDVDPGDDQPPRLDFPDEAERRETGDRVEESDVAADMEPVAAPTTGEEIEEPEP